MRVLVTKEIFPVLMPLLFGSKEAQQYNIPNYTYKGNTLTIPNSDLTIDKIVNIARVGVIIEVAPIWFEIPDIDLGEDIPEGVSFRTYTDEFEIEQTRTWSNLGIKAQGISNSIRYWQPSNNGQFNVLDVEIIQESGYTVLSHANLTLLLNTSEYTDVEQPEWVPIETIQYIDENWQYSEYFDMLHAYLRMVELYEEKGVDNNARWAASTDVEKEILVRWNVVGLNKAATLVDPGWSEGRQLKEIGRKYREFNLNITIALEKRFNDWYQYLNMVLKSGTGKTKFAIDWIWEHKYEYVHRFIRQYGLGDVNALVDFNNVTLGGYVDADFITTTITSTQIVSNLEKVLNDKKYFI